MYVWCSFKSHNSDSFLLQSSHYSPSEVLPETTLFHIMGFLKRLFSIGSKKNKSKRVPIIHNVPLPEPTIPPMNHEDHEAAVGRLLRSTSARVAENSELDYATLPPIRESI
jgi:hypothetical protein